MLSSINKLHYKTRILLSVIISLMSLLPTGYCNIRKLNTISDSAKIEKIRQHLISTQEVSDTVHMKYFVTQIRFPKNSPHLPSFSAQNGYPSLRDDQYISRRQKYVHHNYAFVYTTAVPAQAAKFETQLEISNCIIKINQKIIDDLEMRSQMLINAYWMGGIFKYDENSPSQKETLFFGGDSNIKHALTFYNQEQRYSGSKVWELAKFNGILNRNDLIDSLEYCLRPSDYSNHRCEILFYALVPAKYIDEYYIHENGTTNEVIDLFKVKWKPVEYIITVTISMVESGQTFNLDLNPRNTSILEMKHMIEKKVEIPVQNQHLKINGQLMNDDVGILSQYTLDRHSYIYVEEM